MKYHLNFLKKAKKFKLSSITKEARFREYEDAFIWLSEGRIINPCFNVTDPNIGLKMNSERVTLKCYMADTGLLVTHALDENDVISSELYKSLVLGKLNINEGMFAENIVAQTLVSRNIDCISIQGMTVLTRKIQWKSIF